FRCHPLPPTSYIKDARPTLSTPGLRYLNKLVPGVRTPGLQTLRSRPQALSTESQQVLPLRRAPTPPRQEDHDKGFVPYPPPALARGRRFFHRPYDRRRLLLE